MADRAEAELDPRRDHVLERLVQDRRPGEIESGMMTGSDDSEISATERFRGEVSREEALAVLDPGGDGGEQAGAAGRREPSESERTQSD